MHRASKEGEKTKTGSNTTKGATESQLPKQDKK